MATTEDTESMSTTIAISDELADELYSRKGRGDSYEDVIWRSLREEAPESGVEAVDSTNHSERDDASERASARRDEPHAEAAALSLDERIDAVDVPGSGSKADARRAAVRAAVDHLREHGDATPNDLKDTLYRDHKAEYATARSWWKNCVYPALADLADGDERLQKADQSGRWSWESGGEGGDHADV